MKFKSSIGLLLAAVLASAHAQEVGRASSAQSPVQLIMLKAGPATMKITADDMQKIVTEHVSHLYALSGRKAALAAGPLVRSAEIQGLVLIDAPTPEKALEIEGADPGVRAGLFTMAAAPLLLDKKRFGKWAEPGQFETLYFGFLVNGANRTQDAATTQKLQQQQIAYMDRQTAAGKLVLSGPFSADGERRGIVVYRAPSDMEARQLAEADPMVKAGRLSVRLFTWQVPKGAVK